MMPGSTLLLAPILMPLMAGLLLVGRSAHPDRRRRTVAFVGVLGATALLTLVIAGQPTTTWTLFTLGERLPLSLQADPLGSLFAVFSALMFLIVGIYAPRYMRREGGQDRFFGFYLAVLGMLVGLGYAGNLFTLYLFFEFMTLLCMPLILHSMKPEAVTAAFKFLYYSLAGASLGLVGLLYLLHFGVALSFTGPTPLIGPVLSDPASTLLPVTLLAIVGFGAKAGMVPLHAWLASAHPVAPAPASALLSGVIAKAGIFCVIRFVFYLVGADTIAGTWVQTVWLALSLVGILLGSALALREPLLKRRLAFSSVSQLSYVMFGLALLNVAGVSGALLQTLSHALVKAGLFLIAGAIIMMTGKTRVEELRGIGRRMPVTMICFTVLAVALVGIPPTSGFIGKWYLLLGALESGSGVISWLGPVVLLVSALLTAGYLFPIAIEAFVTPRQGAHDEHDEVRGPHAEVTRCDPPRSMLLPIMVLTATAVLLGLFPAPLVDLFASLATRLG